MLLLMLRILVTSGKDVLTSVHFVVYVDDEFTFLQLGLRKPLTVVIYEGSQRIM